MKTRHANHKRRGRIRRRVLGGVVVALSLSATGAGLAAAPVAAQPSGITESFEALQQRRPELVRRPGAQPNLQADRRGTMIVMPSIADGKDERDRALVTTLTRMANAEQKVAKGDSNSTAVLRDDAGNESLVESTATGVRVIEQISSEKSEHRFSYVIHRDGEAAEFLPQKDGAVLVGRGTTEDFSAYGGIEAPWAFDRNGRSVPARYEIRDGALELVVEPDAETAYPVLADPSYTFWAGEIHCSWGSCTFYLERVKTYWIADTFASLPFALAAEVVAGSLCAWLAAASVFAGIGAFVVGLACEVWATWYAWEIQSNASAGWVCLTIKKYHWNNYPESPGNAPGDHDHCNLDS